jgi:hypothetical protein
MATLYATLSALKRFFIGLAGQPGYKSRISYSDAEYFNLSTMPATTEFDRRDRALVAITALTGARDGAIASLKLKHVDVDQGRVDQDARQVNTKFSKSFTTWFFPVGHDIRQVVVDWIHYLRAEKPWGLECRRRRESSIRRPVGHASDCCGGRGPAGRAARPGGAHPPARHPVRHAWPDRGGSRAAAHDRGRARGVAPEPPRRS